MKIAFNPSTVAALTAPPNNKDITFDLRGRNIFARGVKFYGTDTNTWRPVVDNLTSDSTTSSLSAKQGKVLKALIDGKSDSEHNHDDRYLKLTGGTMAGTINRRSGGHTISGRDHAIIRQTYAPGGSSWNPIACVDTETGTWTLGHLSSGSSDTNFHFCFSTNADYNAGNNVGNYVTLRNRVGTIALTSEIPSKGSWNYDDRYYTKAESNAKYITDITTSVNKLTFTKNGANINKDITVNQILSKGALPNIADKDNTTKADSGLFIYSSYAQTIGTNLFSSVLSINTGGTIQIAGNWGDDQPRNLYWRSQSDRNVANYPWKSWRTILDNGNSSISGNTITINGNSLTVSKLDHNHDGRYVYNYGGIQMDGASVNKNALGMSTTSGITGDWWHILQAAWNGEYRWNSQIAFPTQNRNGMYYRSGLDDNTKWGSWIKLLDIGNSYVKDGKGIINGTTITQVDNSINATNANTINNYHISSNTKQIYKYEYKVDSPEGAWILIKLPAYNAAPEIVTIYGSGNNMFSHCIVHCGSRYQGIWGYQSDYNGTVVNRIRWREVDSGKFAIVALIDRAITTLNIKATNSLEISKTTEDGATFAINSSFFSSNGVFHGNVYWDNIIGKPQTFNPAAHTHTVFRNNLMIKGTNGISDSSLIHLGIGDSDTGFKWISDGVCQMYANNVAVGQWTSGGMNWFKNPTVNGNKVWNAGNDGSGSGLDADTLDGAHLNGLLTSVSNVNNGISVTVGGTTKSVSNISVNQAVISDVANLLDSHDERINQYYPYEVPRGIRLRFQNENNNGLNSGGYYGLLSWRSYGIGNDLSGGYPFQIAYLQSGDLCTRVGTGAQSWSPWRKLACLDSNVASASRLEGGNIPSWGTLTAANGFTNVSSYDYGSRGAYGLCGKNNALYMQLDGYFYQNEGKYRVIDTSDFNWTNLPSKLVGGNEFNIVNAGYNNQLWFNYLPIDNRNSSAAISQYNMCNGNKGLASVYAYRFKAEGKSCMWKDARNYAPFYATFNGGFEPILDIKTKGGDWSIGSYDAFGNHLIFAFTSDSDFNAGVNGTANYWLSQGGEFKINTLRLAGPCSANMGVGSTNPQIIFAEGSTTQQVAITYTDWDTYRVSKGLKVHSHDGSDDANVWFEVQGYNYSSGYVKNGSSNSYVLLGGGGHKAISSLSVSYATSAGYVSNSLNIFGVSYNGSAAKTVTTSTFVSQLPEGTSTVTDGTMFITSQASDSGFADTNAVNVPYKRKASCLWSYIDSKVSSKYLPLAGGTMNGNARIGHGSGNLYIGNSGNDGWIYTQDIASQSGTDKWWVRESGAAHFGNVYICAKSDYTTYDSSIIECYNDALYLNYYSSTKVILCKGGGSVGIGTVPSYKLDIKGQAQAEGFRHSNHNSDDAVLLAGGGYKTLNSIYGGDTTHSVFLGSLNLVHGYDGTISGTFQCLGYTVPFTYTRGGNYCKISIPSTTHQRIAIRAAIASVNYSGGGMDSWTGEHRGDGAWWLHCYPYTYNEVRVKGFRNSNGDNDSWWGGNPLYSSNGSANAITVCLFGYVSFI